MKYLTLKNMDRAVSLIMEKGYSREDAENIAINCFAMVGSFGHDVEYFISNLHDHRDDLI